MEHVTSNDPENLEKGVEEGTDFAGSVEEVIANLVDVGRVADEQLTSFIQEEDKKREQLRGMAKEVIDMKEGNERLNKRLDETYRDDPKIKTMRINEEKDRVRAKIREIDDAVSNINSHIVGAEDRIRKIEGITDFSEKPDLVKAVAGIRDALIKAEETKRGLIKRREETEAQIRKIEERWANIDTIQGDLKRQGLGFAVDTVFDAHNSYGVKSQDQEGAIGDQRLQAGVTKEELYTAVHSESAERASKRLEEKRKEAEGEDIKSDEEKYKPLGLFADKAWEIISDKQLKILARLEALERKIDDRSPDGIMAKIRDAFVKIPNLMAPRKTFGVTRRGTHRDFGGAKRVYDEAVKLAEELQSDFNQVSSPTESISLALSGLWAENSELPKINNMGELIFGFSVSKPDSEIYIDLSPIWSMFKRQEAADKAKTIFRDLSNKFRESADELEKRMTGIISKIPGEYITKIARGEMSRDLKNLWQFYVA